MYRNRKAPEIENNHLCWEPTYTEGKGALDELKALFADANSGQVRLLSSYPAVTTLMESMQEQVDLVEREHSMELEDWHSMNAKAQLRVVNEEQLQDAVQFLNEVFKGSRTATMEQIAAARCFMRAE